MPVNPSDVSASLAEEPLPLPVDEILAHRDEVRQRYPLFQTRHYRTSRSPRNNSSSSRGWLALLKPSSARASVPSADTPSASLYRIYEFLIADWTTQLRNELEYFCREQPSWAVANIPDPADPDPLRYAILAVLTKLMGNAFNRRVDLGLPRDAPAIVEDFEELAAWPRVYEHPPEWALRVPPVVETVFVPDEKGKVLTVDDEDASVEFKTMNIIMKEPHIHFV